MDFVGFFLMNVFFKYFFWVGGVFGKMKNPENAKIRGKLMVDLGGRAPKAPKKCGNPGTDISAKVKNNIVLRP